MTKKDCEKMIGRGYPPSVLSGVSDGCLALCTALALTLDLNVRSGNNYINLWTSLPGTPAVTAIFAAMLVVLRRARRGLPSLGWGGRLLSLFLGAWWVMAQSVVNTKELNQPFLSSSQMLKTAVIALGMACLYNLLLRLLAAALEGRLDLAGRKDGFLLSLYRRHTLCFCALAVLLMWLPHIVISYPCAMNSDTATQIEQVLGLSPRVADHPPFGTFLLEVTLKLGTLLGDHGTALYLYTLLQCFFAAAVIGYSQTIMRRLGAPRWLRAGCLLICGTMPVYVCNVSVLLKDIPYSYAALLLLCEAVRAVYLWEEGYGERFGHALRVTAACVILLNIRNNGPGIVLPVLGCMLWRTARRKGAKALLRCAAVALTPLILSAGIEAALMHGTEQVKQRSLGEALSLPFQQTARFVRDHADEIPPEEQAAIDAALLYSRIGDFYDPMMSDPVKATYRDEATAGDLARYFSVWARQFWRDPACYMKATLIQNTLLFDPQTYNIAFFRGPGMSGEVLEQLTVHQPAWFVRLEEIEKNLIWLLLSLPLVPQLNSLGFTCIVLVMACAIARRYKAKNMALLLMPMLVTLCMIVLGPCIENQDRYGFPIMYCMPLVLACLSHALRQAKKNP